MSSLGAGLCWGRGGAVLGDFPAGGSVLTGAATPRDGAEGRSLPSFLQPMAVVLTVHQECWASGTVHPLIPHFGLSGGASRSQGVPPCQGLAAPEP